MELCTEEINIDFDNIFKFCGSSDESQNKINKFDFIAFPSKNRDNSYYYAQETVNFIKYCRKNDPGHTYEILTGGDVNVLSLNSFDIWMPVIWVGTNVLLPFAVSIAASYIYDKMKGHENENNQVDITFIVKIKGKNKSLHYKGDAKTFEKKFSKIDLNRM